MSVASLEIIQLLLPITKINRSPKQLLISATRMIKQEVRRVQKYTVDELHELLHNSSRKIL